MKIIFVGTLSRKREVLIPVANNILREYIQWQQFIEKFGTIVLSKEIFILNLKSEWDLCCLNGYLCNLERLNFLSSCYHSKFLFVINYTHKL
jgi:hypothetical protein